jgi:hypothetical protein
VTDAPAAPRATAPRVSSEGLVFDPADARYAPLFRRLDEIAGLHA